MTRPTRSSIETRGAVAPFFVYTISVESIQWRARRSRAKTSWGSRTLPSRAASCSAAGNVRLRCACQGGAPSTLRLHLDNARSARKLRPLRKHEANLKPFGSGKSSGVKPHAKRPHSRGEQNGDHRRSCSRVLEDRAGRLAAVLPRVGGRKREQLNENQDALLCSMSRKKLSRK
jgi:hypothetical protein